MRVVVAGATGFVGHRLVEALSARGDEVVVLTRSPTGAAARRVTALPKVRALGWDGEGPGPWSREVDGADAVVNLAGEPVVGRRWNHAQKQRLVDSRVRSTRALVEAMRAAGRPPQAFLNASAVGYYGFRGDEALGEDAAPGTDFLARLCAAWESAAHEADALLRTVVVRIGIVLGEDGGPLAQLVRPFRLGVGGPLGSGRQWVSWIHRDDLVALMLFAIERPELRGVVNATAPTPVRNLDLARAVGRILGRPSWLPVPAVALRVALGEVSGMLVRGQRVLPRRALALGFAFRHPDLDGTLLELLRR